MKKSKQYYSGRTAVEHDNIPSEQAAVAVLCPAQEVSETQLLDFSRVVNAHQAAIVPGVDMTSLRNWFVGVLGARGLNNSDERDKTKSENTAGRLSVNQQKRERGHV